MKPKQLLSLFISLVVAGVFLYLALRGIPKDQVFSAFAEANYAWVGVSGLFGLLAYVLRSLRWNLLFEPLGQRITTSNALWSLSFGYLMNLTIPRSGELARATALYKAEKVPVDQSFGTIILERVIDLVCMGLCLLIALVVRPEALTNFWQLVQQSRQDGATQATFPWTWVLTGMGLGLVMLTVFWKKISQLSFFVKVKAFVKGVIDGLLSIFKLKHKTLFIIYTLGIWASYFMATWLVAFALPETSGLEWKDGIFLVVVGTLGMIIPASGGIGAFHMAVKVGFMALLFGTALSSEVAGQIGLKYAFLSHTLQLVIILVMGMLSMVMLSSKSS